MACLGNTRRLVSVLTVCFCLVAQASAEVTITGDVSPADSAYWISQIIGFVGNTADGELTVDGGSSIASRSAYIGFAAGVTGTVTVEGDGSAWTSSDATYMGLNGSGALNVSDGAEVSSGTVRVGSGSSGEGVVTVHGDGSTWTTGGLYVGEYGSGELVVRNGADVSSSFGQIGCQAGSEGEVTVDGAGSTWASSGTFFVGHAGKGVMNITAGGVVSNGTAYIGDGSDSMSTVTVSGSGSTWTSTGDLNVGCLGHGTLAISDGGAVVVSGDTWVAYDADASGTLSMDGGTLTTGGFVCAAADLTGTGTIHARGLVTDADVVFDATTGLSPTVLLNDIPSRNITIDLNVDGSAPMGIGVGGAGTMRVSDGIVLASTTGHIGIRSGSTGEVTVEGSGSAWTNTGALAVGDAGQGTLNVTGGASVSSTFGTIGDEAGSTGEVTVDGSGSIWTNDGYLYIGNKGDGSLNVIGGATMTCGSGKRVCISYRPGSVGSVLVEGDGSAMKTGGLYVGCVGTGELIVRDGASLTSGEGGIGGSGSNGYDDTSSAVGRVLITGTGTTWTTALSCSICVGCSSGGFGELQILDGAHVSCDSGGPAPAADSRGVIVVDGAGSTWALSEALSVGGRGEGTLKITNGAAVTNASGYMGHKAGAMGEAIVDGTGSTWVNSRALCVGVDGEASLVISNGGTVSAGWAVSVNADSRISMNVTGSSMFQVGSAGTYDLTNDGVIELSASAGLAAGTYSPISVTGSWLGSGTYEAFGGVWDGTAHTFTVVAAQAAAAGVETTVDLAATQRVDVGGSLCVNFQPAGSSTSVDFMAAATSGAELAALEALLGSGEIVEGAYDFTVSGLSGGEDVMLGFALTGDVSTDDVTIWHNDGSGWTEYDATDLVCSGGWASFTVDSFSSYAVSAVPEPATMGLLLVGAFGVLRRRRARVHVA